MPAVIGGEKAWKKYRRGDIGIAFHWVNEEPTMVLFPINRPGAGAYALGLSSLHRYVQSNGYPDLETLIPAAHKAAEVMQLAPTKTTLHAIVDAVLDAAPDLVDMPPAQPDPVETAVAGEMQLLNHGEVVAEREIPELQPHEIPDTVQ